MKNYYAYIRVSTTKQGEQGASLEAQRTAIERYARQHNLHIATWFEEQETAAKRGRGRFTEMLAALRKGKAHGIVVHKIDRSARNLRDWSDIGELIDSGIEVHFVHESLDLTSRGGRLSADIQAVVAADFIRNLRDEVRKGMDARLRQGLYPWQAPPGYKNQGGGRPKSIDPMNGPMVKRAFDLYATGTYNLEMIAAELNRLGFRGNRGQQASKLVVSDFLSNPFYIGIIRMKRTGENFPGVHEPLITTGVFERVQDVLAGRARNAGVKHNYMYRRVLACDKCERTIVGELQKGHIYYRCQDRGCRGTCLRQEDLDAQVAAQLRTLSVTGAELTALLADYEDFLANIKQVRKQEVESRQMQLANVEARLARLTDAFIDRIIERAAYEERRAVLLLERARLNEEISNTADGMSPIEQKISRALELINALQSKAELANQVEMLNLLRSASSNLSLNRKTLVVIWDSPLDVLANRANLNLCGVERGTNQTCVSGEQSLFGQMLKRLEDDSNQSPHLPTSTVSQAST